MMLVSLLVSLVGMKRLDVYKRQGLITYMRTDSTRISPVAQNEAAQFIVDRFGANYSKQGSRVKNASGAQDAHEAIRPSSVHNTPEKIAKYLDKDQLKLYTLIWNRFVASQMTAAVFDTMNVRLGQKDVYKRQGYGDHIAVHLHFEQIR